MAAPANSRKTRGKRWYVWKGPDSTTTERYWSVTTIIGGGIPKPALVGWAAKETALYAIENAELVKSLVAKDLDEDGKLPPFDQYGKPSSSGAQDAYELLTKARFKKSSKAADLGTEIHEAIEAWVLDKPLPDWSPAAEPFMEQAVRWLQEREPKVEMSEASVYNRTYRYAGTLDMIATIDGKRTLIDFKTGSGVYPEAALQMNAYAKAEFIAMPDGSEKPMPEIEAAAVVHLNPDWYQEIPIRLGADVFNSFLYAREVFRWMEEISKTVVGSDIPSQGELV